jgi:hypothetical protein
MKHYAAALIVAYSFFSLGRGKELALNGGFEDSTGPATAAFADWSFYGGFEHGDYSITVSPEAHSGLKACQMTCLKKGRAGIASSPVQLPVGAVVEVSCWLMAKDAGGGRVFLNFEGTPGDGRSSKDLKTGTYGWTRFTHRAVIPAGKTAGPQTITVHLYTSCEGSISVDDFSIQTVDEKDVSVQPAGSRTPAAIDEPVDSPGYRVNVVSPLVKVFREDDFGATTRTRVDLAAAQNEYESVQVVVEAPWRAVTIKEVHLSALRGPGGAVIPAEACKWQRVASIPTTVVPPYFVDRGLGNYPDPLLPSEPFTVERLGRVPLWITLKTPMECPPGTYSGTITVTPLDSHPVVLPVTLTVWDFAITAQSHLRTLTWLGEDALREWYGYDESTEGNRRQAAAVMNYEDCLLEHRLGPGGQVADHVEPGEDGVFDFREVDAKLQRLIDRGMNAFIVGTAPNLARTKQEKYTPEFVRRFTPMLSAYSEHLREKGWLDRAYVYVYDEAPKSAWPEVQKIDDAIHAAAPELRILQCLNEPEGVRALTGFADVFDVYVAQYHEAGVSESQKKGAEVWLAICCYPMEHPNFFIEYPALDVRVTPWICWKYGAKGFEYWSPNSWGVNGRGKGDKWPAKPWVANAFGKFNGDGYLLYPGADGKPLSSIRLEALRDGLEDYEYLWTLNSLVQRADQRKLKAAAVEVARRLLSMDGLIRETGSFSPNPEKYVAYRRKLAVAITTLQKVLDR